MRFAEILKSLRKQNGLTQEALANQLKLSKSTISMYENGERTPTMEAMMPIAEFFGVDMNYLYGVPNLTEYHPDGYRLPPNVRPIERRSFPVLGNPKTETPARTPSMQFKRFPVLGQIACGNPIFADQSYETYVDASADIKADFCLIAQGDSMIGARIQDGDVVFIRSQEIVDNGQIAAVIIDDEATLKRWYYYPEKSKLVLTPENPAYEPLVFIGEELNSVRCLGLAVSFMSNL